MAFEAGMERPEKAGRKPGSLNKKNQEIQDLATELGCNPAKILMLFALGDFKSLGYGEHTEKMTLKGPVIELSIPPDLMRSAASDLMPYLYGKRKPVDSKGDDSDSLVSLFLGQLNDRG